VGRERAVGKGGAGDTGEPSDRQVLRGGEGSAPIANSPSCVDSERSLAAARGGPGVILRNISRWTVEVFSRDCHLLPGLRQLVCQCANISPVCVCCAAACGLIYI